MTKITFSSSFLPSFITGFACLQILLIVTDGASNGGIPTLRLPVQELKSIKVNIFSVGVGQNLNRAELEFMASDPKASHLFYVRNMAELPKLLHTLAKSSCQGRGGHYLLLHG